MQVKNPVIKLLVAVAALFPVVAAAQTSSINAFSPYTMYGIGEVNTPGTLQMRSMGGVGVAMRSTGVVNLLNPAAYCAVQPKTFLFNFGLEGQNYYNSQTINNADKSTVYNTFNSLQLGGIPYEVLPRIRPHGSGFRRDGKRAVHLSGRG